MTEPQRIIEAVSEGSVCVGLDYRIGSLTPCTDPECPCDNNEMFLVAVKEAEEEWWGVAGFTKDPEGMLSGMAVDPEIMRIATSTILYGASWDQITVKPWFVYTAQCDAVAHTPERYWELSLDALKGFRSMINTHEPKQVCALLNLTDKWAFDPGGSRGAPS